MSPPAAGRSGQLGIDKKAVWVYNYSRIKKEIIMKDKNSFWMAVSGATGILFFLIANFTDLFHNSSVIAGCLQLCVNAFVFAVWTKGFAKSRGLKRFVAFFGVVVPIIMASITILRVLIPAIVSRPH